MVIPKTPPRVRFEALLTEYAKALKEKTPEELQEWAMWAFMFTLRAEITYILGYAEVPKGKKDIKTEIRNKMREEYIFKMKSRFYD